MIERIGKVSDFRSALMECMLQFDASKDTAEHRVRELMWESRDNRKIGADTDVEEYDSNNEGLGEIAKQISDFDSLENKKIFLFYAIANQMVNSPSDIYLPIDTNIEALNNDNAEANEFMDNISIKWQEFDETERFKQYNRLIEAIDKLGVSGKSIMEDIQSLASDAIKNPQIGALQKQFQKRGLTECQNWDDVYLEIRDIKSRYRESLSNKEKIIFNTCELANTITYAEYLKAVEVLKRSIVYNIETSGGEVDATIF